MQNPIVARMMNRLLIFSKAKYGDSNLYYYHQNKTIQLELQSVYGFNAYQFTTMKNWRMRFLRKKQEKKSTYSITKGLEDL